MTNGPSAPAPVLSPMLEKLSLSVRHGFFGRDGGVSTAPHASLNCGMGLGDKIEDVRTNRERACRAIGGDARLLALPVQVHSAEAVICDAPYGADKAPKVDALVTAKPGLCIGVVTADCAPILMCDPHAGESGVCAAVHAGWRGAVSGVIDSAIARMEELGAEAARICAAVGPCLKQESFEVGPDLVDAVGEASPWADDLFAPGEGDRSLFDFDGYLVGRLTRLGVGRVEVLGEDTLTQPRRFFSHRYAVQRGSGVTGRNLSVISLLP